MKRRSTHRPTGCKPLLTIAQAARLLQKRMRAYPNRGDSMRDSLRDRMEALGASWVVMRLNQGATVEELAKQAGISVEDAESRIAEMLGAHPEVPLDLQMPAMRGGVEILRTTH